MNKHKCNFYLVAIIFCLITFFVIVLKKSISKIDFNKKQINSYIIELRNVKEKNKKLENLTNIDYEKAITLGMLICGGNGDNGELHTDAPLRDKKGIEQVIENRIKKTGRSFYQEATAEYQFSSFNYDKKRKIDGLVINKYNIPRQTKCLIDAINVISENDLEEFNNSTFFHAYGIEPKWKKEFIETTRTKLHIFYSGDDGYKDAKIVKKKIIKSKNNLKSSSEKSIDKINKLKKSIQINKS